LTPTRSIQGRAGYERLVGKYLQSRVGHCCKNLILLLFFFVFIIHSSIPFHFPVQQLETPTWQPLHRCIFSQLKLKCFCHPCHLWVREFDRKSTPSDRPAQKWAGPRMLKSQLSRVSWSGNSWMPFTIKPALQVHQQPHKHSHSLLSTASYTH